MSELIIRRIVTPCLNCNYPLAAVFGPEDTDAFLFCPSCKVRAFIPNDPEGIANSLVWLRHWAIQIGKEIGPVIFETLDPDTMAVIRSDTV